MTMTMIDDDDDDDDDGRPQTLPQAWTVDKLWTAVDGCGRMKRTHGCPPLAACSN
ncbi:hypothetical protein E4U54_007136, partial [Claviceps lovelessii]